MKKNILKLKITLSLLLLICSVILVGSLASADSTGTLSIQYGNVAYKDMTQLAFTLSGSVADGSEAGIAVWNSDVSGTKTIDNVSYTSFTAKELDGKTYYLTKGIPAPEMSVRITVAPCVKDSAGNITLAGAQVAYSIYDYVKDRLDDDDVTDVQIKLYSNLIYYGNAAEQIFNDSKVNFPLFIANGGEAGKLRQEMAFADGNGGAVIRANAINGDGDYFLYWTDKDGNKLYDRVNYVTATAGNNVYTAVYGDAAESAYAGSANFDNYSVGDIDIIPGGTITGSGPYYMGTETSHFNNLLNIKGFAQVTSATDSTPIAESKLSIKEERGANYLSFEKVVLQYSYIRFNNLNPKKEEILEVDFRLNTNGWVGGDSHLYFNDGTNGGDTLIYIDYSSSGALYIFDKRVSSSKYGRYAGTFERGETISLRAELTDAGLEIYVNGKLLTATGDNGETLTTFSFNNSSVDASKAYSNGIWMAANTGCKWDIDFLGVNFVDRDLLK